eukprot:gene9422-1664_t
MTTSAKNQPMASLRGTVVKGFGRGSKELGIPTANFDEQVIESLPESMTQGIYYGWAQVDDGDIYQAVMSIGWNPYYHNTKRSAEVHIIHDFPEDFYGSQMKMLVIGYIRPEMNFDLLDALISAIHNDINVAKRELETDQAKQFKTSSIFNSKL